MADRTAPVQGHAPIPWSVHERAWEAYAARYGRSQSAERIAERGGFGVEEMDMFHPTWREESEEIPLLRKRIAELEAERNDLAQHVCDECSDESGAPTGWVENRVEGRVPCVCVTEIGPYADMRKRIAELERIENAAKGALWLLDEEMPAAGIRIEGSPQLDSLRQALGGTGG